MMGRTSYLTGLCSTVYAWLAVLAGVLLAFSASGQGLVINEFSNGPGGSQEWVELLVVGDPANPTAAVNIDGWRFDDNDGSFTGGAATTGHLFFNDSRWQTIAPGSLIVIYNELDPIAGFPADDAPDALGGGDGIYVLPGNSALLAGCSTPSSTPCDEPFDASSWFDVRLRNGGDAVQVRQPSGSFFHGLSYGNVDPGPDFPSTQPTFNVGGGGGGSAYALQCGSWELAATYLSVSSAETPAASNGAANATLIANITTGTGFDYGDLANPDNCVASASADLSISKTLVTGAPYVSGQMIEYTIVVSNAGPDSADNVMVNDTPAGMSITSVSPGCSTGFPCNVGTIAANASVTLTVLAMLQ